MKKKFSGYIPGDEIDRVLEILKETVVLSDSLQVDHILRQLEAECKRVLSLFKEVTQGEIDALNDANEVFWLQGAYPYYASPFGETINTLAAVFLFRDAYARRHDYTDDFTAGAKEEADRLGVLWKTMRLGELETSAISRSITAATAGRLSGQTRRADLSIRDQKIKKDAEYWLTVGLSPRKLIEKLSEKTFDSESLSPKQMRRVLRQLKIIPPQKKRTRS